MDLNEFYVYENKVYSSEENIPDNSLDLSDCQVKNSIITCKTRRPMEDDYKDDGFIYAEQYEYEVDFEGNLEPYKEGIQKGTIIDVTCQ